MKKLLALVLALVMTLGLATVSTSAAYSDADDINYDEAVDVMTAIGVFQGKGSNFDPKANLNRAEAAKIVAYLMLGNSAAENLKGSGAKFTDVPASHWASGYIEYLASVGIVSGKGDNKFDPNGQVTAIELAKMLLVALGYDATIEKFVGSDWAINIQSRANKVGIFDGNDAVLGTAAVSRDEAALYAFNTIKAPLVEYENKGTEIKIGDASVVTGASNWQYKTSTIFKNQTISKDKLNNGSTNETYIVEFAEEYYKDLKLEGLGTTTNDFGEPIHKWTNKNIEVGTYVVKSDLLETYTAKVTAKMLYELLGKSRLDSIEANDVTITVYEDGVKTAQRGGDDGKAVSNMGTALSELVSRNDSYKINNTGNGSVTEVFVDGDNDITVVTYHTYVYQASNNYNASTQNLTLKTAGDLDGSNDKGRVGKSLESLVISSKDYPEIEDVKTDDYLLIAVQDNDENGKYEVGKVAKAKLLTGKVEAFKVDNDVTIDGTTYKYSEKTLETKYKGDGVRATLYSVGQDTTVVLDAYNNIIAIDDAVVNANYVFISRFGSTSGISADLVAKGYFTDGTSGQLMIDKVYNTAGKEVGSSTLNPSTHKQLANAAELTVTNANGTIDVSYAGWYTFSKGDNGKYNLYMLRDNSLKQTAAKIADDATDGNDTIVTVNDKVLFAGAAGTSLHYTDGNSDPNIMRLATNKALTDLRANEKTIFIVHDESGTNDDVYVYTGVKNTPDIKIAEDATGKVAVVAAYKSSGYAEYVFISAKGAVVVDDGSNEALLYVAGNEGTYRRNNNEVYYKWRVLNEARNGFTTKDATVDGSGFDYEAIYRVRVNNKDEYSGGTPISGTTTAATAKQVAVAYSGKYISMEDALNGNSNSYAGGSSTATGPDAQAAGKIVYNNNTLWLNGYGFTLADDAKLTLVLTTGARTLMNDKRDDREAMPVTASELADKLKDYPFAQYDVQARLDDNWTATGGNVIKEAYITVTSTNAGVASAVAVAVKDGTQATTSTYVKQLGTAPTLTATVTADAGTSYTYQWYRSTNTTYAAGSLTKLNGATGNTYKPNDLETLSAGTTYYYYCVVTATNSDWAVSPITGQNANGYALTVNDANSITMTINATADFNNKSTSVASLKYQKNSEAAQEFGEATANVSVKIGDVVKVIVTPKDAYKAGTNASAEVVNGAVVYTHAAITATNVNAGSVTWTLTPATNWTAKTMNVTVNYVEGSTVRATQIVSVPYSADPIEIKGDGDTDATAQTAWDSIKTSYEIDGLKTQSIIFADGTSTTVTFAVKPLVSYVLQHNGASIDGVSFKKNGEGDALATGASVNKNDQIVVTLPKANGPEIAMYVYTIKIGNAAAETVTVGTSENGTYTFYIENEVTNVTVTRQGVAPVTYNITAPQLNTDIVANVKFTSITIGNGGAITSAGDLASVKVKPGELATITVNNADTDAHDVTLVVNNVPQPTKNVAANDGTATWTIIINSDTILSF